MSRTHLAAALFVLHVTTGLKEQDFRKCSDTPFCQLHRLAPEHGFQFQVEASSVAYANGALTARLHNALTLTLTLTISVLGSGAVRVHIDEDQSVPLAALDGADPAVPKPEEWDEEMDGEWIAPRVTLGRAVKGRFRPEDSFASATAAAPSSTHRCTHTTTAEASRLRCKGATGDSAEVIEVELRHAPLVVAVHVGGDVVAVVNGRQRLRFEHFRQQRASEMAEAPPAAEPHTFGKFTDPLPFGSSSVGLDISFPHATHAYGLPERTVAHALEPHA
jgi:alpha 1,3-glucosidase